MIIAMPSDRERRGSEPIHMASLNKQEVPSHPVNSDSWLVPLAVWCALCHRYARQTAFTMDSLATTQVLNLKLELDGSEPLIEMIDELKHKMETGVASAAASNCAYFPIRNGEVRDQAATIIRSASYELVLLATEIAGAWSIELFYNTALHDRPAMERLLACYQRWLRQVANDPSSVIDELPMLTSEEITEMEQVQNGKMIRYPETSIPELIVRQGQQNPEAIAVSFADSSLSYGELLKRSSVLTALLQSQGISSGSIVGVCLAPGVELLIAILGIWRAGAIYCPLDPTHPEAYIQHMLDLAEPAAILVHSSLPTMACLPAYRTITLDKLAWQTLPTTPAQEKKIALDRPAYLFFTSGTTGKPKGVLASHRNLAHYILVAQSSFAFGPSDVFISMARYTFSISLFELISPLCVGARLILTHRHDILNPERLVKFLEPVTVLHAGPSLLSAFFRYLRSDPNLQQTLPHLRHVSSGGDIVTGSIMEDMKRVFNQAEIFVLYGSTEISCMGTFFPVSRQNTQIKSVVGRCFPGVKVRILDKNKQALPFAVVGDIYFSGPGVALGYYKRPDLEQEKFHSINGERFYSMGDIGRMLAPGDLEMLGRMDYQIQLRGIRIELVGIENRVRELGLAHQCAIVHKKEQDQEFLVFFLVGAQNSDIAWFRKELAVHLPDFMLPQYLVVLDKLPLTVNGKLDRNSLQELPWQSGIASPPAATPQNILGQQIAAAFAKTLNLQTVGMDQNFFDLGGHSMLAILLLQEIRENLNRIVPPQVFFEHPTVQDILRYIEGDLSQDLQPIPLNRGLHNPKLFMLAGVQTYRPLAKRLEGHFAAFAVITPEELSATEATSETLAVERLADHYLRQIRSIQAHGPYHLLGYSFAGIVAYELAQKLRESGELVNFLVLIDAIIPEWNRKWRFRWRQLHRMMRRPPQDLFQFFARRLKEKFHKQLSDLNQFREDPKLGHLQEQRVIMKSVAAVNYLNQRQAYPDPCLLIVSEDRLRRDPLKSRTCGWSEVIPHLNVHSVAGDHFKMVEQEPDVTEIARIIIHDYEQKIGKKEPVGKLGYFLEKNRVS